MEGRDTKDYHLRRNRKATLNPKIKCNVKNMKNFQITQYFWKYNFWRFHWIKHWCWNLSAVDHRWNYFWISFVSAIRWRRKRWMFYNYHHHLSLLQPKLKMLPMCYGYDTFWNAWKKENGGFATVFQIKKLVDWQFQNRSCQTSLDISIFNEILAMQVHLYI